MMQAFTAPVAPMRRENTGTFVQKVWFATCIIGFVGYLVGCAGYGLVAGTFQRKNRT